MKSKILFYILLFLITLSAISIYYKYVLLKDFEVTNEPVLEESIESME